MLKSDVKFKSYINVIMRYEFIEYERLLCYISDAIHTFHTFKPYAHNRAKCSEPDRGT